MMHVVRHTRSLCIPRVHHLIRPQRCHGGGASSLPQSGGVMQEFNELMQFPKNNRINFISGRGSNFVQLYHTNAALRINDKQPQTSPAQPQVPPPETPPPGRIRAFIKKFGLLGFCVWASMWVIGLPVVYVLVSNGWLLGDDVISKLSSFGIDKYIDISSINPALGNFAVAFAIVKVLEVVRLPLVFALTAWLRKKIDQRNALALKGAQNAKSNNTNK